MEDFELIFTELDRSGDFKVRALLIFSYHFFSQYITLLSIGAEEKYALVIMLFAPAGGR
jgi:hypothetical protein